MPDLPKKKVGIVSCSGEELAEGTVTRLAALKVLQQLRPDSTVTICLPLFLAGGEGDRAFAKFYPTIAVDGCELRCAARATEMYSSKPAASLMIRDVVAAHGLGKPENPRRLNAAGKQAVEAAARQMAETVDVLLGKAWDRRTGSFFEGSFFEGSFTEPETSAPAAEAATEMEKVATCSCGSGIPVQKVQVNGQEVVLVALPLIFKQLFEDGKPPSEATGAELLATVKIYNPIPADEEEQYRAALLQAYSVFCREGVAG